MLKILYVPGQDVSNPQERLLYRLLSQFYETDFVDIRTIQEEIDVSVLIENASLMITDKIKTFNPDILVGHSVGAAIIAFMVSRGQYKGPACLLSCGHYQLYLQQKLALDEAWISAPFAVVEDLRQADTCVDLSSPHQKLLFIHGGRDDVISVAEVAALAATWRGRGGQVDVRVYQEAGHDCLTLLADDVLVKQWMSSICPGSGDSNNNNDLEQPQSQVFPLRKSVSVVGVCGPSGSGKSSLVNSLKSRFGATVIHMDRYFNSEKIRRELGDNWETPEGIDIARCISDLRRAVERLENPNSLGQSVVIIEGFLLFYFPELVRLIDVGVMLAGTRDVCRERRRTRSLARSGRQNDPKFQAGGWFDKEVWHYFLKHQAQQTANFETFRSTSRVIINSDLPQETVLVAAVQFLEREVR